MKFAFFGSSLVSAYWNGAATYYRGIIRALHERGHEVVFYEPDAFDRQKHRDIPDPPWAKVVVYEPTPMAAEMALRAASESDVMVKASGVGVLDGFLEEAVLAAASPTTRVVFWDVDAPATLERMRADGSDPFRKLVPSYDGIFTYGGGEPVVQAYESFGARTCVPIYNALDPDTHHPVEPEDRFSGDLAFLGNRLPDRDERVERFFFAVANELPDRQFVIGGNGWQSLVLPPNVRDVGHVYTKDHNAFNCTPRAVLNINRASMARFGFSPATRVFEAAGAAACLITDAFEGVELFLEPGEEILVAEDTDDVVRYVRELTSEEARRIGRAARERVLAEHTYAHRALDVERAVASLARPKLVEAANG